MSESTDKIIYLAAGSWFDQQLKLGRIAIESYYFYPRDIMELPENSCLSVTFQVKYWNEQKGGYQDEPTETL